MNWLLALATYLEDQGVGTKAGDIFIGVRPDIDGLSILLTQSGGDIIETYASGIQIYRPQLQIRVRGLPEDFVNPFTKIESVQSTLVGITNQTLSGIDFLRVKPLTGILAIGQDDNLAYEFTANFEVSYE